MFHVKYFFTGNFLEFTVFTIFINFKLIYIFKMFHVKHFKVNTISNFIVFFQNVL